MKFGSNEDDRNTIVTGTLPTLPFDLVAEIFCRLPVKLLLQLQCLGKSLKSLISDPKFTKKHLQFSKAFQHNHHLIVNIPGDIGKLIMKDCTIPSVFNAAMSTSCIKPTKLRFPDILNTVSAYKLCVSSCDGILCFTCEYDTIAGHSVVLWNPSIRRFNMFPVMENPGKRVPHSTKYNFGYGHSTHTYKIVGVSFFPDKSNEVCCYTLGTDCWRRIQDLPYGSTSAVGVFARGTINWLAYDSQSSSHNIVSLDLEKESYQKLLKPNLETDSWSLRESMDCLCIFARFEKFVDIWIMKRYDNEEPWSKLYRVPYMHDLAQLYHAPYLHDLDLNPNDDALYITEDDQVLMYYRNLVQLMFTVYDSKSGTFNMSVPQDINGYFNPEVYVESLISPCP
ncbi:putative F-box domain, galactose oxidase/kelch, beta-propeller, F-box associated interaction [Medicago truncatula]|uniref:F-box protein interaction domain protein n=1 Tax=Medicago truncatula TaxID=3880 RepID=G7IWQ4_MEDTR|nr:F-box protein CPR1 [Medicago truncatula]AES69467.1 F-box protein interaction domain protein [Medicago truncatula]RHN66256.1 putative F-box domain, galactose oxidase/kelch, beta-propeller, F-box associated interaction [Medicago truncatula]